MNVLIPLAGDDAAFREAGFHFTKSLVEIRGKPLVQHVYEALAAIADARFTFVIRKEHAQRYHLDRVLRLLAPTAQVVLAEGDTAGAACTCLLAVETIAGDEELVVTNGDHILRGDLPAVLDGFRSRNLDGGTVVFESVHPRWSYVRVGEDGLVAEAAEKRPISRYATAGFYYFRRGEDFVAGALDMIRKGAHVDGRYYVCPVFNEMLLRQKRVGIHLVPPQAYISLATPEGVALYGAQLDRGAGAPA